MNYKKKKHNRVYAVLSRLLMVASASSVVVAILLYSSNVKLSKQLRETEDTIDVMNESIALNKQSLYSLTDFQDLDSAILDLGLIKELSPQYLDLTDANSLSYR